MNFLITGLLTLLGGLTLVGQPAPDGIGPIEMTMVLVVAAITGLSVVVILRKGKITRNDNTSHVLILVWLYAIVWIISALVGLVKGASPQSVFRSIIPYLVFLPLVSVGLAFRGKAKQCSIILMIIGLLQAAYMLYLFLAKTPIARVDALLMNRTTWNDLRLVLPLFLASAVLPLPIVFSRERLMLRVFGAAASLVSIVAAFSTQTRAQVLAIFVGITTYLILRSRVHGRFETGRIVKQVVVPLTTLLCLLFSIPHVRALSQAMIVRTRLSADNGRILSEWVPAIHQWLDGGVFDFIFGIGSGYPFVTAAGDLRTYIHNVVVYLLVYTGILGVGVSGALYYSLFRGFLRYSDMTGNDLYNAYASLLVSLFVYSLFFAVHKVLSYNLLLFIMVAVVLSLPAVPRRTTIVPEP